MKIGIITDSATGFSLEEMKKYPEITVVPLVIIDHEKIYDDNEVDITSDQIYQKMIKEKRVLKTSQTNRENLREIFNKALKKYDQILFLPIAKAASGQYESAKVIEPEFNNKVYIYETGAAMVPLKFMALIASHLAKEGKSLPEILKSLDNFRLTYECYLAPNNLTYLARGGRAQSFLASAANLFKLKTILKCKEKIARHKGLIRTMNASIRTMLELTTEKIKNPYDETLYVIDGWCDKDLLDQAVKAAQEKGFKNIKVEPLCNILKTHTGDNTIGFSIVPNQWIKEV